MAGANVPYLTGYGNITKALERIKTAQVPPRFSQDFLETKLSMKGGSARPVIPFLKRTGFLGADGTPTPLYRRFRNESQGGAAAAAALRIGYAPLYEINEYLHDATDSILKGVVVQQTGAEPSSSMVKAIVGSFKALKAFADFDAAAEREGTPIEATPPAEAREVESADTSGGTPAGIKLGYTINLNLPATTDIAVFDAIFKSLKENLL